jgi:hypothetical protein
MDKDPLEKGVEDVVKPYELLDRVRLGRAILIRDDQFDRETLFDVARAAREKRIRMSLLDTGRFEPAELEWLIQKKVRVYTSDEARPREDELDRILEACRKAGSFLAYFHDGSLEEKPAPGTISLSALKDLTASGMDFHISSRAQARDFGVLAQLAENARKRGAYLAYYHHGPLFPDMIRIASRGGWIHFSDRSLGSADAADLSLEILKAARDASSRLIIYVEQGLPLPVLQILFDAGAAILFRTPPSDCRSLQMPLEEKARKRKLPLRASYLSPAFLA